VPEVVSVAVPEVVSVAVLLAAVVHEVDIDK
jgi:hypothetical protein